MSRRQQKEDIRSQTSDVSRVERSHIDRLTVIAIAVIAYAAANITHEIIGHCGMALILGTKCTVLSSFHIPLAEMPPRWKYNVIVAAGVTANFVVGIVCVALLRKAEVRGQRLEISKQETGINQETRRHGDGETRGGNQEAEGSRQKAEGGRQTAGNQKMKNEN